MNFAFDDDQKSLGDTVAQVLADFPALTGPALERPRVDDVWAALAELGLFALLVPERYDGVGLDMVDVALAVEALGAGLAPATIAATLAATDLLVRHGSEEQQRSLLPRIASGNCKFAFAFQEAERSYAPEDVRVRFAEGRLSGSKILVADARDADVLIVLAQLASRPTLLLVPRDASGIVLRDHHDIDPSAGLCAVSFEDVKLEEEAVLGRAAPTRAVVRALDVNATLAAGALMGIAARMLAAAVEYARTREQFGRPIGAFQAIKHRCADMAVSVEAGRSVTYYGFWAISEDAPDRARASSMAKAYAGDVTRQVCNEAIQVHGGMGFTWEMGLHRYLRRAKVVEHSFGDTRYHQERVLAETLAGVEAGSDRQLDAA